MQLLYYLIKDSRYILHGTLCCQIKHRCVVVSHLACIKTDVEAHKVIRNCGLVYPIDREKLHQLILQEEFVHNIARDQMFISDKMVFQIHNWLHYNENDSVFLIKLLKLIRSKFIQL